MRRRVLEVLTVAVLGAATAGGCAQTVEGVAQREDGTVPDPDRTYGYVDDRCGLLDDSTVQATLGAARSSGPTAVRCASTSCPALAPARST